MRTFSWTDLLAQFEKTLPENVRITAVQPRVDRDGRFIIGMRVEARQIGDLEKFLDALEMTGAFHNVLTTDEQATDRRVARGGHRRRYTCSSRAARLAKNRWRPRPRRRESGQ